jgi:hypothetical protein
MAKASQRKTHTKKQYIKREDMYKLFRLKEYSIYFIVSGYLSIGTMIALAKK